jgi:hypothetical protein
MKKHHPDSPFPVGTKVKRGPTWMWGDQDKSGVGTVLLREDIYDEFTVRVRWPDGTTNGYRCVGRYSDLVPAKSATTFEDLL